MCYTCGMHLICPVCGKPLIKTDRSAVCENRHSFDYAKSGYLNLLRKASASTGDDRDMVSARTAFLSTGSYAFLRDQLCRLIPDDGILADLGCGEGYYTSAFPCHEKYGFDLSKAALIHAANHDHSTQYVLSSIFHLPLADHTVKTAVTCFAPATVEEIGRILTDDGLFIHVTPGPDHLYELKEILYEHVRLNPDKKLSKGLTYKDTVVISNTFHADTDTLISLFRMTPYAWRTGKDGIDKLKQAGEADITAQFHIHIYAK